MTPSPLLPLDAEVLRVSEESSDTRTLVLRLRDSSARMDARPGQFNMVGLPGIGEAPITFSAIGGDGEFAHTIRGVGSVTRALIGVAPGGTVQVRGPYGSSWPEEELAGRDVVAVAGGNGIIPLRPLLQKMVADRRPDGSRLLVLYGGREPGQLLFRRDLDAWASAPGVEVRLTVDEVPDGWKWDGPRGVVTGLLDHPSAGHPAELALVCGPELMMRFAVRELLLRGMRPADVFVSLERRMKCGIGHCGHCQLGPNYVCADGPVFRYPQVKPYPDAML